MTLARRLGWLALYALAMGWLEAAVVVYLRALYYPDGFAFPLLPMPPAMALVEIAREAATLVMILAVAAVAASSAWEAFLHFAFVFGVWDLVYYAGLWLALRWPPSLLTPDILFLIPVPWVGPVLAPVIISLLLVAGAVLLLGIGTPPGGPRLRAGEWVAATAGGVAILASFMLDGKGVLEGGPAPPFRWGFFMAGLVPGIGAWTAVAARFRGIMGHADSRDPRPGRRAVAPPGERSRQEGMRMTQIKVEYEGELHCNLEHGPSGARIITDAPPDNQGKGEAFSPTDLLAASLGSCIMTVMGIYARRKEIDLRGSTVEVSKEMISDPLRRIGRLAVVIELPDTIDPAQRQALENAARTCPVERSLHPDVKVDLQFRYGRA